MTTTYKRAIAKCVTALVVTSALMSTAAPAEARGRQLYMTATNATSHQPLSRGILVIHAPRYRPFRVGAPAGAGLARLATEADPTLVIREQRNEPLVYEVLAVPGLVPGGSFSRDLTAARRRVAVSYMAAVGCANDAFVGYTAQVTANTGSTTAGVPVNDAGREQNNQELRFISQLCDLEPGGMREHLNLKAPEASVVSPHQGIVERGDLDPQTMAWDADGAAVIQVVRGDRRRG